MSKKPKKDENVR